MNDRKYEEIAINNLRKNGWKSSIDDIYDDLFNGGIIYKELDNGNYDLIYHIGHAMNGVDNFSIAKNISIKEMIDDILEDEYINIDDCVFYEDDTIPHDIDTFCDIFRLNGHDAIFGGVYYAEPIFFIKDAQVIKDYEYEINDNERIVKDDRYVNNGEWITKKYLFKEIVPDDVVQYIIDFACAMAIGIYSANLSDNDRYYDFYLCSDGWGGGWHSKPLICNNVSNFIDIKTGKAYKFIKEI